MTYKMQRGFLLCGIFLILCVDRSEACTGGVIGAIFGTLVFCCLVFGLILFLLLKKGILKRGMIHLYLTFTCNILFQPLVNLLTIILCNILHRWYSIIHAWLIYTKFLSKFKPYFKVISYSYKVMYGCVVI